MKLRGGGPLRRRATPTYACVYVDKKLFMYHNQDSFDPIPYYVTWESIPQNARRDKNWCEARSWGRFRMFVMTWKKCNPTFTVRVCWQKTMYVPNQDSFDPMPSTSHERVSQRMHRWTKIIGAKPVLEADDDSECRWWRGRNVTPLLPRFVWAQCAPKGSLFGGRGRVDKKLCLYQTRTRSTQQCHATSHERVSQRMRTLHWDKNWGEARSWGRWLRMLLMTWPKCNPTLTTAVCVGPMCAQREFIFC